jgi:RHS repeat-associated protein
MFMKRMKLIGWQLCAIGLWLLSALCGECFWNPGLRDSNAAGPPKPSYSAASTSGVYGPFGEAPRAIEQTTKLSLQFPIQDQDDETDQLYYGYRYYNPSTGRWLSRDPIEERGFESVQIKRNRLVRFEDSNPYGFTRNDPLTKIDLLGLSERDVTTILDQFRKTMKNLCGKGRRCDCVLGPLKDIHAFCTPVWGCGAQADTMEGDIISLLLRLDDGWRTEHRRALETWPCFYHQDVQVRPTDAKSGGIDNIVLDTFRGCYTVTHRSLVQMPDPTQSFWLYTYETECYTCDDFKNKH